ncbi:MAG: flagellar biosynthesis anti-sigma factor FlgM [Gemmatimonadota bacterium]|nr:flagellar biosynthesis anti-sigma factor FlgM [Gemmatimonadota bacterium]
MKITGTPSPEVLAATTNKVRETGAPEAISSSKSAKPETPAASAKPRDSVEISDAGRALAGSETLSTERVAELRQRILSGAYNATQVVDTVARRILQRGDI